MKLKPKTSRRLLILGAGVLALAVAGAAVVVVGKVRSGAKVAQTREAAFRHLEQKDYYKALGSFAQYLKRPQADGDREALVGYAKSREHVEEWDGRHVRECVFFYQKALAMDPTDRDLADHLLELYQLAGFNAEARDLAKSRRPDDLSQARPEHAALIRTEAIARLAINPRDEMIERLLRRVLELTPDDFAAMVQLTEHLRERGRAGDAQDVIERLASKGTAEDKARARLLTALSRRDDQGYDAAGESFRALCEIAGLDPASAGPVREVRHTEALEVLRLAALFDSLNAPAHAVAVLGAGARDLPDEETIKRILARRLWMLGRTEDLFRIFPEPDLSPRGTPTEILVYRALSLLDTGKGEEAGAIIEALGQRAWDYRARAWTTAWPAVVAKPPKPAGEAIEIYKKALEQDPRDPVLLLRQGDEYERAGRLTEARRSWEAASNSGLALGWTTPWLRRAYVALAQGRPLAAIEAAEHATRIAPRSSNAFITFFRAHVAAVEAGYRDKTDVPGLLAAADRLDAEFALQTSDVGAADLRQAMLPGRVSLTGAVRGAGEAGRVLDAGLAAMPGIKPDTLYALLDVSRRWSLGRDAALLARLETADAENPRFAINKAATLAAEGKKTEAEAWIDERLRNARPEDRARWLQTRAQFLDGIGSPDAASVWMAACDEAPTDVTVQLAALRSPSVTKDPASVERLIDRAASIAGYNKDKLPAPLRLARAKALLAEPLDAERHKRAVDILRAVTNEEPDWLDARTLLVQALGVDRPEIGIVPRRSSAIEELRDLIPLVPNPDPLSLEMGRLVRAEGDAPAALGQFERLALSDNVAPAIRLAAIDELIAMRELNTAAAALERVRPAASADTLPLVSLRMAGVMRAVRRDARASEIYETIDPASLKEPEHILALAVGLREIGREERSREALLRLDSVGLEPGEREVTLAKYEATFGDAGAAERILRAGVARAPEVRDLRVSLINLLVETGRTEDAARAAEEARAAIPDEPRFGQILQQLAIAGKGGVGGLDLEQLARVLDQNTQTKPRAEMVRTLLKAQREGKLSDGPSVLTLKQQFRSDAAMLTLLARALLRESPPRVSLAADVIRDAMRDHPTSTEVFVLGVDVFRAGARWNDMAGAAQAWQQLTRSRDADLALAEARINLGQPSTAIDGLQTHTEAARRAPTDEFSVRALTLHGVALVKDRRAARAFDELGPLLGQSPALRTSFWLPTAGAVVEPFEDAMAWIDRAREVMDASSEAETIAVASAYAGLAQRFTDKGAPALAEAEELLAAWTKTAGASARAFEVLGGVLHLQARPDEALAAYEAALAKNKDSAVSLRGMADIVLQRGDTGRALDLARRAAALSGDRDVTSAFTAGVVAFRHGRALAARGDKTGASAALEESVKALSRVVQAEPDYLAARLSLIDALNASGRVAETLPHHDWLVRLETLPAGVSRAVLQNNFADAVVRAGKAGADLDRARGLVMQAVATQPLAPFYDTLGGVEALRKDEGAAARAYRRAVELDPELWSSWVGLATVLARTNDDASKAEAAQIAERVRRDAKDLSPELRAQLDAIAR
ncbi:MAG TPA: tetratricopeptide repeat protein [Phycisphaerales bacterium]|nr:tetratricopeptide repeat protein [Phycisphaerales bacterium]